MNRTFLSDRILKILTVFLVPVKILLCNIVRVLSYFSIRSKSIIVFGSSFGKSFCDNPKYLYLHYLKNHPQLKVVWITTDDSVVQLLRNNNLPVFHKRSLSGIWYMLRAKYYIFDHGQTDISPWFSGRARLINLWHGIPLKRTHFGIKKGVWSKRYRRESIADYIVKNKLTNPDLFIRPHAILAPSNEVASKLADAHRVTPEQCIISRYPRTLPFNWSRGDNLNLIKQFEGDELAGTVEKFQNYIKVFIYLPTYRDSGKNGFEDSGIDLQDMNNQFNEKNYLLVIKVHPWVKIAQTLVKGLNNVILLNSEVDIYPILPFTDVLITDYSSIYFDYLYLDREIIFFPYDLSEYTRDRGLYYDYDEVTPGIKVYDYASLLQAINSIDEADYTEERKRVKELFLSDCFRPDEIIDI